MAAAILNEGRVRRRRERRQARQDKRQARQDKRAQEKLDRSSLGGSAEAEKGILAEAGEYRQEARESRGAARADMEDAQGRARRIENTSVMQYQQDRNRLGGDINAQRASIGGIGAGANQASNLLGQAYGQNQLTGSTESILGQRAAGIDAALAAQTANMQQQTQFAQGQLGRRAMGMAAGMGEGGALGAQQAMASLVGGGADMAAQAQMQNAANAAAMRAADIDYSSGARLNAAQQERANQLATAGQQAQLAYNQGLATNQAQAALTGAGQAAQNTSAGMQQFASGQANDLTQTETQAALQDQGQANDYSSSLLTAKFNADQAKLANKERSTVAKVLMPFGMLGK